MNLASHIEIFKCPSPSPPWYHSSSFTWRRMFSCRSTPPSSSRHYNRVASSLNPWASTLASSPTLAASSCQPTTPRYQPMSSSTHLPAWPCSPPPSHLLRSQWPASLSRTPQVCVTAWAEKINFWIFSVMSWINDPCWLWFCRFSGSKPCHGQLWVDSWRHQRSGNHTDHQQPQSDSSPRLSVLFWRSSRKPSGDHSHHIRYEALSSKKKKKKKNVATYSIHLTCLHADCQKQNMKWNPPSRICYTFIDSFWF